MHLIPASWSHLHILVSVFPSVGFLFCIGVYVAALATNNELMKRACLALFGALAILAIPTYLSGDYSGKLIGQNPLVSQELLATHTNWGLIALGALVMTGIVAWFELFNFRRRRALSNKALYIVLGLSLVTMVLMVVVGELGWEISHHEIASAATQAAQGQAGVIGEQFQEGQSSQTWSHIHIILNHFPTVGFVLALFFFVTALWADNDGMKRVGLVLFTMCALLIVPTYVTGGAAMWALTDPPRPEISKMAINAHRDMALLTLFGLMFTGGASWIELWRYRHLGRFSRRSLTLVLLFAIVTLLVMAETGHRGGLINHPEMRLATDVFAAENPDAGFWTPYIELTINNVIWFVPWQTLHFFGYSMIFATVLISTFRVLGVWKTVSWPAVHRFLPLAFFGVLLNVFSGMLMFLADTFRYANNTTFAPKMVFLVIGGVGALYFSLSNKLWNVKAGEDAPLSAKAVALIILLAWTGVVAGGRLLPYL
jgi:uncharacterized membrane protein